MSQDKAQKSFRDALLEAAAKAAEEGTISQQDLRRIRILSHFPAAMRKAEQIVKSNADAEGHLSVGAPDWSALLGFIKELVPLILELIKLFS